MLRNLSKLSLEQVHAISSSGIFDTVRAFAPSVLENAPIPEETRKFLVSWNLPRHSHIGTFGGFTVFNKASANYGSKEWFPRLADADWLSEYKVPIPTEIGDAIVMGWAGGVLRGKEGKITGHGKGGPICIKSDGSLVYFPEEDGYREYAVNTDAEKFLYCLVFFQTMTSFSRKRTKRDTHLLCTVRPDYCDTIRQEMRVIDAKAIESRPSFWTLMLDLACANHPLVKRQR